MILSYTLLVLGVACLLVAATLLLRPWRVAAAVPAYAGLALLHWSYFIAVPPSTFIFWGAATLMVTAIAHLAPAGEPDGNRAANLYIALSAMAGAMLGMIVGARIMVLGVVIGTLVGTLAYSSTPAGRWLRTQPARNMAQYFGAKGLPAIVATAIIAIAIEGFIL